MPHHANQTSFKPGFYRGFPKMTAAQKKQRAQERKEARGDRNSPLYWTEGRKARRRKDWERQIRENGWTPEAYAVALEEQGGVCFICLGENYPDRHGFTRRLAADHCHKTGKRRHLLCNRCNTALGLLEYDIELIKRLEAYCAEQ